MFHCIIKNILGNKFCKFMHKITFDTVQSIIKAFVPKYLDFFGK